MTVGEHPSVDGIRGSNIDASGVAAPGMTGEQRRIVEWGDGPVVVIAGAGTGKTRVIVERVKWLLETAAAAGGAPAGAANGAPDGAAAPRQCHCSPSISWS